MRLPRSFTWLGLTQFVGALCDALLVVIAVNLLIVRAERSPTEVVALTAAAAVGGLVLFSHLGGLLADRFSKGDVVVVAKCLQVLLVACVWPLLASGIAWGAYAVVLGVFAQQALLIPSMYGMLPDMASTERLCRANGILIAAKYGALASAALVAVTLVTDQAAGGEQAIALLCATLAVAGVFTAVHAGDNQGPAHARPMRLWLPADLARTLRSVGRDGHLVAAVAGLTFFLAIGALGQRTILLYGQELGLDVIGCGILCSAAAAGVTIGSLAAGRLCGRNIEFGLMPLGTALLTGSCFALAVAAPGDRTALAYIALGGAGCGVFVVPLLAFIQHQSPTARRGEVLAAVFLLGAVGAGLAHGAFDLGRRAFDLGAHEWFAVSGGLTAVLTLAAVIVLPDFLVRFIILLLTRCVYRIHTVGAGNVPADGPALLVSNHVTRVDALLISATQHRRIRFVMGRRLYHRSWLRPLFTLMGVIPISAEDPPRLVVAALRKAREALDDGHLVCIFAEGAITRNGLLRAFRPGLERIVRDSGHPIVPLHIGGAWGSVFSYHQRNRGSTLSRKVPYPVSIAFGMPLPSSATTAEVRQAVQELSIVPFDIKKSRSRTLGFMTIRTARRYWYRKALWDTTGKSTTFLKSLTGAVALGDRLYDLTRGQDNVGILLPPTVGSAIANFAVTLLGKVPVNLNYTVSRDALESAVRQAQVRTVLSSRVFLAKMESLTAPAGTVYLEDVVRSITPYRRAVALLKAIFCPTTRLMRHREPGPDDVAAILFSSGTVAEPKGIMLSHHNLISNIEAFQMLINFTRRDRMCAVLPFFHSFGFTCTLWAPALIGFSAFYHVSPLDAPKVAEMVRVQRLTVMLATPTFLVSYMRRAEKEDFASLNYMVVGAEKLKPRIADAFEAKFGFRPLEGYGATELSPVAAVNLPDVDIDGVSQIGTKEGSIGHPVPGVAMKIVNPESYEPLPEGEEGMLMVKGPNVMTGYLNDPARTADTIRNGWYESGDIGTIDSDGFVFLHDRISRFSKIAGEMVPHEAVEEVLAGNVVSLEQLLVVASAPDDKKGEQLVVFHREEAGTAESLYHLLRKSDLPNLWKPRRENFCQVDEIPMLGSGKVDIKRIKCLALEFVENRPGLLHRITHRFGGTG